MKFHREIHGQTDKISWKIIIQKMDYSYLRQPAAIQAKYNPQTPGKFKAVTTK